MSIDDLKVSAQLAHSKSREVRESVRTLRDDLVSFDVPGEAIANITLAYRHIQDAEVRLSLAVAELNRAA